VIIFEPRKVETEVPQITISMKLRKIFVRSDISRRKPVIVLGSKVQGIGFKYLELIAELKQYIKSSVRNAQQFSGWVQTEVRVRTRMKEFLTGSAGVPPAGL
jgi:uncharacterized protein YdaL